MYCWMKSVERIALEQVVADGDGLMQAWPPGLRQARRVSK
jgi:hypothetical protein